MPVVISLLNAFTGLAAAATGFVLHENVLIVSGALVGASGTLLTIMMGRAMNRSLANVLFGAFGQVQPTTAAAGAAGRAHGPGDHGRGRRGDARVRAPRRLRPRLRPRRGAGAARRPRPRRPAAGARRRREVRDPPRRRTHARAHERPPRGGERPVRRARRDGADQPGVPADGRGGDHRRQRRRQPVGALRHRQPDLRHADPRRRQGRRRRGREAVDEPRIRGHRQPAVLRPEDRDAVRATPRARSSRSAPR